MSKLTKYIGQALVIAAIGFVLLNVTFMFFAALILGTNWVISLFTPQAREGIPSPIAGIIPLALIIYFSWLIYRSKLNTIVKATYTTIPTAVGLVIIGISLYRWPIASFSVGSIACCAALYYLSTTKQPWQYYFSIILVGIALLLMALLGVEI